MAEKGGRKALEECEFCPHYTLYNSVLESEVSTPRVQLIKQVCRCGLELL